MKIIVLGASGMLGFGIFKSLSLNEKFDVFGTVRSIRKFKNIFSEEELNKIIQFDAMDQEDHLQEILGEVSPDYVINCIGLITQEDTNDKSATPYILLNSLFPHKVAKECSDHGVKLVHFSTDCVFSGSMGNYSEKSIPDAVDYYGRSKLLGEIEFSPHLTIRTSIIGHELFTNKSLIDWFLSQDEVHGYTNAVFSGLPVNHISDVLNDFVLGKTELKGIYHLSADPINKYELLKKVALIYEKNIKINRNKDYIVDKSLDSSRFKKITGYSSPSWDKLITSMHNYYLQNFFHKLT
tara:strand:- start:2748 stop:3632 length:885 start_codon:yes stop_codon:yes gene_type:complete